MRIRIKSTPPGEIPEEIREAWVGVEIGNVLGPFAAFGPGDLTGPVKRYWQVLGMISGNPLSTMGFQVGSQNALAALASHSPSALDWWKLNAPRFFNFGESFFFPEAVCEIIHEPYQLQFDDRERRCVASVMRNEAPELLAKLANQGITAELLTKTEGSGIEFGEIIVKEDDYERACDLVELWEDERGEKIMERFGRRRKQE